ncbi:MAG: OmpA family protein [Chitinophagaceae bacterium]
MKRIAGLILAALLLQTIAFCQKNDDYIQDPTLGIQFFFHDFKTASLIRSTSLHTVLKNKQFGRIKEMSPGLALNYIQGISKNFDVSSTLSGAFLDYPDEHGNTITGEDVFLMEADVSLRAKLFSNRYWVSPYAQAGVGASMYSGKFGALIPAGIGVQINFYDEAFLLVNAQYRIPVTETVSSHFFYSVGIAGTIGKRKAPSKPLPPPPLPMPAPPPADRDGDGIIDSLDACPDVKGLAMFKGCPDTDGDGIPDKDDKCPSVAGVARYQGCPIPDRDGDGINDEEDKCPDVKGLARYQGCPVPDRDKDGVNDEEDKCPDLPGPASNNGCPEIKEDVRKRIEVAASNIFFVTGSSKLLARSNNSLDEVAKLMTEDANLKLDIEGHTDNVGKPAANQLLSENRAKAVYDYLLKKGIDPARLRSAGFGQDKPVADNKTAAGRTRNRRVELKLHYD